MQGLDLALDQLETLEARPIADILRRVSDAPDRSIRFEGDLLGTLRRYYPEPLIRWIARCALYPALHWELTCYLGRHADPSLLTAANLHQLTRLPWFVEGRMPDGARLTLIQYLADIGDEAPAREALRTLLDRAPAPPADSLAYADYRMNVILNELMLRPDPARRRQLEQEFEAWLRAGESPDFVNFKLLDREPTRLDLLVPERWKRHLFRQGLARFGLRIWPRMVPLGLLLALAVALWPLQTRVCLDGELLPYADHQLCLRNAADSLRYFEYHCADAIAAGDTTDADRWIAAAQALRPGDTVFCHNSAARCHNHALEHPDKAPCPWLLRADSLFRSAYGRPGAEYVLALQRARCTAEDEAPASLQVSGLVLDQSNGQPLSGAEVQAEDLSTRTDTDGRYTLDLGPALPPLLRLRASAPGYQSAELRAPPQAKLPPCASRPTPPAQKKQIGSAPQSATPRRLTANT